MIWPKRRRRTEDEEFASPSGDPEWGELLFRYAFRLTAAFLLLFGAVFLAFGTLMADLALALVDPRTADGASPDEAAA